MAKIAPLSLGRDIAKCVLLGGCCLIILWGCSSRGQSSILSRGEPEQIQKTDPPVEEIVMEPIKVEGVTESPPVTAPPAETKIFTTPKTEVAPFPVQELSSVVPEVEPLADVEPEMPVIPSEELSPKVEPKQEIVQEQVPVNQVHAPAPVEQEPIQIAKVVPPVPEKVEIVEEDLVGDLIDVYFDYDRFTIREDAVPALTNNANLLMAQLADKKIVIEGHCDERGTRSYNMILGERRAQSVKTYLQDLGVPADKLQVVSFGKDKPFCNEQSKECWQENRRGHFVLQ